jgi:ABC-2 type transport system permease protein
MNRGLMFKAVLEMWPATLMCGVLLFGVEAVLAYVLPTFQSQFSNGMLQIEFVQSLVGAMLGVDASEAMGPQAFMAFPWVHPVVLALIWAHAMICCTRMPCGEIDRGTIDLTLTLPVTRWSVLRSETVVWIGCGVIVLALGMLGYLLGRSYVPPASQPDVGRTLIVLANCLCLYLAVGGLAWCVSASFDRRGPALALVFLVLLASFLLNFLGPFWSVAKKFSFLGLLDYYRPMVILRDGLVPWSDMTVLLVIAATLWIAAGIIFSRRDICTV